MVYFLWVIKIPRTARELSSSNIYHVMLRGINRQVIFENDGDRHYFMTVLNYCKELNRARIDWPMIANGENEFVYVEDDILLMRRTLGDDFCLIAMNFSPKAAGECPVPPEAVIGTDIETGEDQASLSNAVLVLPPYAIVILK